VDQTVDSVDNFRRAGNVKICIRRFDDVKKFNRPIDGVKICNRRIGDIK